MFLLTCSLKANASCVPLGEMRDIGVLDPAKIHQRESKNDYVDLVSRSHEADDGMWVGHNEALDRTMTATGSRTVNGKGFSFIDSQSDRVDVANEVSLRKVSVSAVPLMEMSYPMLESNSKTFRRSTLCRRMCQRCSRSNAEGNAHLQMFLVFFLVWRDSKRSSVRWLPMECHVTFWTLIVILIQSERTPTHSEVEDQHLENSDERL